MDTTLVSVTLLSMAMAMTLSVVVWRMLRLERRRSDARVVALTELAARAEPKVPHVPVRMPLDLPLNAGAPAPSTPLFAEPERSSPWGSRVAIMTALALIVSAVVLFALAAQNRATSVKHATAPPKGTAAAANMAPGGLELLSLRETRQPGSLTITGLVQNPRGGAALNRVSVTAFAFDRNGAFLASGRALLDVTALAPGDQSPFVVTVPVSDSVARYRIGFRTEDGRVLAHVDKRQPAPVAQAAFNGAAARGTS